MYSYTSACFKVFIALVPRMRRRFVQAQGIPKRTFKVTQTVPRRRHRFRVFLTCDRRLWGCQFCRRWCAAGAQRITKHTFKVTQAGKLETISHCCWDVLLSCNFHLGSLHFLCKKNKKIFFVPPSSQLFKTSSPYRGVERLRWSGVEWHPERTGWSTRISL